MKHTIVFVHVFLSISFSNGLVPKLTKYCSVMERSKYCSVMEMTNHCSHFSYGEAYVKYISLIERTKYSSVI